MALFIGHIIPGTLFSLLGSWWMYNIWMRYFLAQKAMQSGGGRRSRYTSIAAFPCPCLPKYPLEGIFKAVVVPFGMLAEYLTGFKNGRFVEYKNLQHLTMYFFFALSGIVDILIFYRAPIPRGTDYASAVLGFSMEGLLFFFHLHMRSMVDVQMHVLLLCVVVGCVVLSAAEAIRRHSVLTALARCFFVILQGTWLVQMAFLLYWPYGKDWKTDNHEDFVIVTVLFCWHNAGIFTYEILMGLFVYWRVKNLSPTSVYFSMNSFPKSKDERLESLGTEQVQKILADSEEEEDII